METATLDRPMQQTPSSSGPAQAAPTSTTTSVSKTAVLVGLCFLTATFTFAIGNALIHSYFSSATSHGARIAGVFLLGVDGLAVMANGLAMRRVLGQGANRCVWRLALHQRVHLPPDRTKMTNQSAQPTETASSSDPPERNPAMARPRTTKSG